MSSPFGRNQEGLLNYMGCTSCTTDKHGLPKGCKSNGHCKSGGCNKLNTFDWLADIPIAFGSPEKTFYEVSFKKGSRKAFYKNGSSVPVDTGDYVMVDTAMGYNIGVVTLSGELVRLQMRKKKVKENSSEIRNIIGIPDGTQMEKMQEAFSLEKETLVKARTIARSMKLNMKIGDVEFQADKTKATFFYTAEERVDFRELIKMYAKEFKVKVEMRQIGSRQEAGRIGGIGDCGRELCCSTWLTDFKSVSTNAARYQNLSINLDKLSGQCGRLKCCLNYELDTYLDAAEDFPKRADVIETQSGPAYLQKTDILKKLMFYAYEKTSTYYPVTVEKVKEILEMNKAGKKPEDLTAFAQFQPKVKEEEEKEADLVGHISLETLEKSNRKKKGKNNKNRNRNKGAQGRDKNKDRNRN